MTVRCSDTGIVILEGACGVEDAEPLSQLLQVTTRSGRRLDNMQPPAYSRSSGPIGVRHRAERALRRFLGAGVAGAAAPSVSGIASWPSFEWNQVD